MPHFEVVTVAGATPAVLFARSLDVDVHAASMSHSGERAIAGLTSGQMALGDRVTWRARHFGVWWHMTSRITAYEPPWFFKDEQIRGPFAHWCHEHYFEDNDSHGTVMRDVVDFASPYGWLGRGADSLVLDRYLMRLIQRRNEYLVAVAGPGG